MSRWTRWLDQREAAGLLRTLPGARSGVSLSSNDYLGLSTHPRLADALTGALARHTPVGSTGSRLLTGDHPALRQAEQAFASWQGAEACVWFSTGYAANVGLLSALLEPGDRVVSDRLNHASLIDGMRLGRAERVLVPHGDLDAITHALTTPGPTFVVVESLYSMDGDLTDLDGLIARIADRPDTWLLVDEAHATGLYGPQGQGRVFGRREHVLASVHTLGKALGTAGAMVCCSEAVARVLINRARSFVFSTAPPPVLGPVVEAAIALVSSDPALRARPLALGARLRDQLPGIDTGGSQSHIVPIVVGSVERALVLSSALAERGWDAMPIRPPTVPEGACRVRLVVHAGLDEAQIDALAADIREVLDAA